MGDVTLILVAHKGARWQPDIVRELICEKRADKGKKAMYLVCACFLRSGREKAPHDERGIDDSVLARTTHVFADSSIFFCPHCAW